MKIKSRHCRALREFVKINRKYARHALRKGMWYVWLTYDIIGFEKLNDPYLVHLCNQYNNNLRLIRDEVITNYGRVFTITDRRFNCLGVITTTNYRLVGIEITNEDYYYILQDDNGHTEYCSCAAGLDMIDEFR